METSPKIDFEALRKKFETGRKHTEAERLRGAIARRLALMVRLNRSRMNFLERFQQMVDAYNAGAVSVDEFFRRLVDFVAEMNEEDRRGHSERLSEEELAVFDILSKPEIEMTGKDRRAVKKTARRLLETLKKGQIVLDWRKRQQARAQVRVAIEEVLDHGLPRIFTADLFKKKADALFQHVYESYWGPGQGVYEPIPA